MTVAIGLLTFIAAAIPVARRFDPSPSRLRALGLAFLLGPAFASLVLLAMSIAGIRWHAPIAALLLLALPAAALFYRGRPFPDTPLQCRYSVAQMAIDAVIVAVLAGFSIYATIAEPWEWDFWAIWGLKAKLFLLNGGIDFGWLAAPWNSFAHPDYPPLLPLLFDATMLAGGTWDGRWLGLVYVVFAAGATLLARGFFARENCPPLVRAAATLAVTMAVLSTWIGMAEGPLLAYAAGALLYLRSGFAAENPREIACGSFLLGCAALTKNEGVALAVAVAAAALVAHAGRRRLLLHLWPAIALALPWQIVRRAYGLETDLFEGTATERAVGKLESIDTVFRAIAATPMERPWLWAAVVVIVIVFWKRVLERERFLLVVALTELAFFVGAYLVTPHGVEWHVSTSWSRLLDQAGVPLTLLAIFSVVPSLAPVQETVAGDGASDAGPRA